MIREIGLPLFSIFTRRTTELGSELLEEIRLASESTFVHNLLDTHTGRCKQIFRPLHTQRLYILHRRHLQQLLHLAIQLHLTDRALLRQECHIQLPVIHIADDEISNPENKLPVLLLDDISAKLLHGRIRRPAVIDDGLLPVHQIVHSRHKMTRIGRL